MRVALPLVLVVVLFACAKDPADAIGSCDEDTVCRDSDCDTICDRDELNSDGSPRDTDADGTPDHLDDDSDGDRLPDRDEAGDSDPLTPPQDINLNGVPDARDSRYPCATQHVCTADVCPVLCLPEVSDAGMDADITDSGSDADTNDASSDADTVDSSADAGSDAAQTLPDAGPDECLPADVIPEGCVAQLAERLAGLCDGADNDCDGQVDEGCGCVRGSVQPCFAGPPGRRGVGGCSDGTQQCIYDDEFSGKWDSCVGGILPGTETCDGLDNDCNGCRDEIDECQPVGSCPGPDDPRVPEAQPFETYLLRGGDFYGRNDVKTWRWRVTGPPCDRMFATLPGGGATATNGRLSYTLRNPNRRDAELDVTLSGAYAVTLTVTRNDDSVFSCTWIVNARAPGLRVELCWPNTGATALSQGGAVDLDLHLGKQPETVMWSTNSDCYWLTCGDANTPWSFANTTNLNRCTGPLALNYTGYELLGYCPNPRLDIDNRDLTNTAANNDGRFVTENINLDNPTNNQRFRVMVDYFGNALSDTTGDAGAITPIATEPLVNVYCGGELVGTFGGDPDVRGDPNELSGFDTPGQQWRVVDIQTQGSGNNLSCVLTPLTAQGTTDYDIRSGDSTF